MKNTDSTENRSGREEMSRREALKGVAALGVTVALSTLACRVEPTPQGESKMQEANQNTAAGSSTAAAAGANKYPFALPPLPYEYNALDQYVDEATMRLHHDKHHQTYVDKLNDAIKDQTQFHNLSVEDLLRRVNEVPEASRTAVRNHGGGHANHSMFWKIMRGGGASEPTGALAEAVNRDLGGLETMKTKFNEAGEKHFGSGWVFVTTEPGSGKLEIISRPNQDSPLMENKNVLFGNDVWEHAYYLKYQNKRGEYLKAWWNTVNWQHIAERFESLRAGKSTA